MTKEVLVSSACVFILGLFIGILWKYCFRKRQNIRNSRNVRFDSPLGSNVNFPRYDSSYLDENVGANGNPGQRASFSHQVPVKRLFKGDGEDIWSEFIQHLEYVATINGWNEERIRIIFFTVLRGQAETYAYGLPMEIRNNWTELKRAMDDRFGHRAMKESYVAEAKMRKKKHRETFRDFGQAIEDLYRKAYPDNRDYVQESSMKTFLDNCSEDHEFRFAVKRTRPRNLQDAVTAAMQEECIRLGENRREEIVSPNKRVLYTGNEQQNKHDVQLTETR